MSDDIERRADMLKKAVNDGFEAWKRDPAAFAAAFPGVRMTMERGKSPAYDAMTSIATDVMMGSRFEWRILEFFGADPMFAIGLYEPERPER